MRTIDAKIGPPQHRKEDSSVGVILNAHREGIILSYTLDSLRAAAEEAAKVNVEVNIHLVIDRGDEETLRIAEDYRDRLETLSLVDFGNLGHARSAGVRTSSEPWLAFLDGDDLISSNWLRDAYSRANQVPEPKNTIFHTEMFVGFGNAVFYRRAMSSADPEFDPICLLADWFFCNNLFAHRSVFERYPVEPYDHDAGFGAEDWHWSCETIAHGVHRDFVPETTYFYRIKPAAQSLGMVEGLIHKRSRLFDREMTLSLPFFNTAAPEDWRTHPAPMTPRFRYPVPDWVLRQALQQSAFDADTVEVVRFAMDSPDDAITFPPRIHYGVAQVYRETVAQFDDRPKLALFWRSSPEFGGDYLLPEMANALAEAHPDHQLVVFCESGELVSDLTRRSSEEPVVVVDINRLRTLYQTPDAYLAALLVRFFIQFEFGPIYNVGSATLDIVLNYYGKALRHSTGEIIDLAPFLTVDLASQEQKAWLEGLAPRSKGRHTVICLDQKFGHLAQARLAGAGLVINSTLLRGEILGKLKNRWRVQEDATAVNWTDFIRPREEASMEMPAVTATRFHDITLAVVLDGFLPDLISLMHTITELRAMRVNAKAVVLGSTREISRVLLAMPEALVAQIEVQEVTGSVASVLTKLQSYKAPWLVILQSSAWLSAGGVKALLTTAKQPEGIALPGSFLARQGQHWHYHILNPATLSATNEVLYLGGLAPIGAVATSIVKLNGALKHSEALETISARMTVHALALLGGRSGGLNVSADATSFILDPTSAGRQAWQELSDLSATTRKRARREENKRSTSV